MKEEKRYAGTYEIIESIHFGLNEFVVGEDQSKPDLPYMTARYECNEIIGRYFDMVGSSSYAEIMGIFAQRIADEADRLQKEVAELEAKGIEMKAITKDDCTLISYEDDINGKVIVIKPSALKREFRSPTYQLRYCTGGFGASPNSRGSAVFCTNLYTGKETRYERRDVLGVMDVDTLPKWAKDGYDKIMKKERERRDAR